MLESILARFVIC